MRDSEVDASPQVPAGSGAMAVTELQVIEQPGWLARVALRLTDWTERWVPDAFVFALFATLFVVVAGFACTPSTFPQVVDAWGKGLWELIPFTLQMALVIITGHVLATSRPVGKVIRQDGGLADDAA